MPDEPDGPRRWATPTGEPCPRAQRLDGSVEGGGDCLGCGFCLLLAGLLDIPTPSVDG
ncbi:MAG TPA: hypothetical protein VG478_08425 [Acidimicrobiales bacterium]|nr:hypothetical protein [Acidimicrobiales bacterium]